MFNDADNKSINFAELEEKYERYAIHWAANRAQPGSGK